MENKNFMNDHSKKLKGKEFFKENLILDKKIKMSKSIYAAESLEKEFDKILRYKNIISNKNNLFFDSPKIAKTGVEFYSKNKSSDKSILPKLNRVEPINTTIKTTSNNFFKNNNLYEKKFKHSKLFNTQSSNDLTDNNHEISDKLKMEKMITHDDSSTNVNKKLKNYLFFSQTTNNNENLNDKISQNFLRNNESKIFNFVNFL